MHVGERIKQLRLSQNLTMTELAKRGEVSQSGLSEIESGKRSPTLDVLERVVKGLGITIIDFFDYKKTDLTFYDTNLYNSDVRFLIELAGKLNKKQLHFMIQFLESLVEPQ